MGVLNAMKLLGAAATFVLPQLCAAAGSTCYYPNGHIAAPDAPCDPDAENSPCCGAGSGTVCLTNGLCMSSGGGTIRGSCTDQAWEAGECPDYCMFAQTGGTDLVSCSNVTHSDTSYCCDGYRAFCCDEGVGRFDVFPSSPQIAARFDSKLNQFTRVPQRTSSSSSSTSSATSTGTSSTDEPTTATGNPTSSSPTESSTSQPTSEPDSSDSGLSTGAKAGIGVGAAVMVLSLIAVVFLLIKLRKAKQAAAAAATPSTTAAAAATNGQEGGWDPQSQYYQHQQPYGNEHKDGPPYYSGRVEMGPGLPPAELGQGQPPTRELDGYELSSELPSSPTSWQQQQYQQHQEHQQHQQHQYR